MPLYNRRPELPPTPAPAPLGLTELLSQVRLALQRQLAESYWVVAEVSDLTVPRFAGAHCYLTLTEQTTDSRGMPLKAQARATLWSQRYQQLGPAFERATGQPLRPGLKLLLRVQVRFHEQYGLSLDVVTIDQDQLEHMAMSGQMTDAKTLIGLLWLRNWKEGRWPLEWRPAP